MSCLTHLDAVKMRRSFGIFLCPFPVRCPWSDLINDAYLAVVFIDEELRVVID